MHFIVEGSKTNRVTARLGLVLYINEKIAPIPRGKKEKKNKKMGISVIQRIPPFLYYSAQPFMLARPRL